MDYKFVVFVLAIVSFASEAKKTTEAEQRCQKACALQKDEFDRQRYRGLINPFDDECYCYPADTYSHLLPMRDPRNHPWGVWMEDKESLFPTDTLDVVPAGDCTSGIYSPEVVRGREKPLSELAPEVANCITRCREHYLLDGGAGICIESKCYCYRIGLLRSRDKYNNWETHPGSKWGKHFEKFERQG